jgi:hypothetical protein
MTPGDIQLISVIGRGNFEVIHAFIKGIMYLYT